MMREWESMENISKDEKKKKKPSGISLNLFSLSSAAVNEMKNFSFESSRFVYLHDIKKMTFNLFYLPPVVFACEGHCGRSE